MEAVNSKKAKDKRKCRECQGPLPPTRYFKCTDCIEELESDDGHTYTDWYWSEDKKPRKDETKDTSFWDYYYPWWTFSD